MDIYNDLELVWTLVGKEYRNGLINSERCLQASLFSSIRKEMPSVSVFVEPSIDIANENRNRKIIPDLVLCNESEIIGVMEIKFVPHHYAEFESDLSKFTLLASEKPCNFPLSIDPYTGAWDNKRYSITDQTLFIFTVISRHDSAAISQADIASHVATIKNRFVLLTGSVGKQEPTAESGLIQDDQLKEVLWAIGS